MSVRAFRVADSYGATAASGHHQRFVVDLDSEIPASANAGDTCYSLESGVWRTWQNDEWNAPTAGPPDPHTHTLSDITDAVVAQFVVPLVADSAAVAWTNMPAAATIFAGSHRHVTKADLTNFTEVRLVLNKQATAGAASSVVELRYATSFGTAAANYSAICASPLQVAVNVQNTVLVTAWTTLIAGAQGDVFLALVGSGGDGVLDPAFGNISAQFR